MGLKVRPEFRSFAGSNSFASNEAERFSERPIGRAFGAAGVGAGVGEKLGTFGIVVEGTSLGDTTVGSEPSTAGGAIVGTFGAETPPSITVPSSIPSTVSPP